MMYSPSTGPSRSAGQGGGERAVGHASSLHCTAAGSWRSSRREGRGPPRAPRSCGTRSRRGRPVSCRLNTNGRPGSCGLPRPSGATERLALPRALRSGARGQGGPAFPRTPRAPRRLRRARRAAAREAPARAIAFPRGRPARAIPRPRPRRPAALGRWGAVCRAAVTSGGVGRSTAGGSRETPGEGGPRRFRERPAWFDHRNRRQVAAR